MRTSSADVGQLSAQQKRALLEQMLLQRASQPKDRPLSIGQERLYRLVRLDPDVPLYNVAVAYRLGGPLDLRAMEQAVHRIEDRHEILRTTFPLVEGEPVQHIAARGRPDVFARIDLHGMAADEPSSPVQQAIEAEATRAIDLAQGPLWRVALLRLGTDEHILVLTMHHIVTDGWSFELFLKELSSLYAAFASNVADPLPALAVQYAEYAARQRDELADAQSEAQRQHWSQQLAGSIPALRLPVERAASSAAPRAADSVPLALPGELSQALMQLSQRENASLFMTLLAGFEALLNRSTGQEELLLCVPVTGRHRSMSKELIGYFNNILPMRLDASGDPSLLELLRRARGVTLDAYKNQDVPFQWTADLPSLRRIPLSRLLFSLDMEWPPKFALDGLACEPLVVETGTADFDLSVSLWLRGAQVQGSFRYKRDLFDRATIERLVEHFQSLLQIIATDPARTLSSLPQLAHDRAPEPATAADEPAAAQNPAANWPRSALELRLAQEWEAVFEKHPIGIRDDLQSLGASSLAVASLAERIHRVFRTDLPVTAIFQAGTIEKMAVLLQSHDPSLSRSPLAPIQPHGAKKPLFLCEGVGIYYSLVPYLGEDQPVYGLVTEVVAEYPGVKDLAAHYLSVVLETQPQGPYFLGGVSFGGLVAFEMAQQLHAMGREVGLLALMDTPGPGAYRLKPAAWRAIGHLRNLMRYGLPYLQAKMGRRFRHLARKRRTRDDAQPASMSRLIAEDGRLRTLLKQSAANYETRPYAGRIVLFMLAQRDGMSDSLFDPLLGDVDPLLGWGPIAAGGVERHELQGGHVSILREPFVRVLGERLRECLARDDDGAVSAARSTPATASSPA